MKWGSVHCYISRCLICVLSIIFKITYFTFELKSCIFSQIIKVTSLVLRFWGYLDKLILLWSGTVWVGGFQVGLVAGIRLKLSSIQSSSCKWVRTELGKVTSLFEWSFAQLAFFNLLDASTDGWLATGD